jgi:hypothetical protein
MINSIRTLRFRFLLLAALVTIGLGPLATNAFARGRSFPIEITGAIISFDGVNQTFTIRIDEPAQVLTVGVGRDCKFKQNGATANERIIRRGSRVKVSYFATIFTGNIAVEIDANPTPEVAIGIIENVDVSNRRLVLSEPNSCHLALRWARNAKFIRACKPASAAAPRVRSIAEVAYYAPAFASKYAVRIEFK